MKMFVHCPNCGAGFDAFSSQEMEAPGPAHHFEVSESQPRTQIQYLGADYINDQPTRDNSAEKAEIARLNKKYEAQTALRLPEAFPGLSLEYDGTEWTGRRDHKVASAPDLEGIVGLLHSGQL